MNHPAPSLTCTIRVLPLLAFLFCNVTSAERPNILFLFSDDHAIKSISAYGGSLAAVAAFMSLFWLLATAAGKQKTGAPKIVVGQPLPAYTALNEDGSSFDSQSLAGAPYLLKFFRGHW